VSSSTCLSTPPQTAVTCAEAIALGTEEISNLGQKVAVSAEYNVVHGSGVWAVTMHDLIIGLVGNTPSATPPTGPPVMSCSLADVSVGVNAMTGEIVGRGFQGVGNAKCPNGTIKALINPL